MNRSDFFKTLIGGAAVAAGAGKAKASKLNTKLTGAFNGRDVQSAAGRAYFKGFVSFEDDPYERIMPGAFGDSIPMKKHVLMDHAHGKSIGQILEVSHTRDGIGFTYAKDKI